MARFIARASTDTEMAWCCGVSRLGLDNSDYIMTNDGASFTMDCAFTKK